MSGSRAFVLDTNVLVDALLFKRSFGRRAFDLVRKEHRIVFSPATFGELADVLYRPRVRTYVSEEERRLFMTKLGGEAEFIVPNESIRLCRDPKDDKFLEVAVASNAEVIITRDADLLILDPFRGIRILEAKAFVESSLGGH